MNHQVPAGKSGPPTEGWSSAPPVSDKSRQFTESVIREMTRLALEHNALNLAQGFPDFPAPAEVKEAAVAAIRADINQYAITWGAQSLREAIARAGGQRDDNLNDNERSIE